MDLQLTFDVCISLKWEPKEEEPGSCRRPTSCVRQVLLVEGSLEVKLPTIWRDEKQSREEA
jgi:hypothetical protein